MSFYNQYELKNLGLKHYGENVLISDKCSIYNADNISIGDNVRIDDFCILSGNIEIGNYVHISAYCALYGKFGIKIGDFSGLSPKSTIFSASDDFSGEFMTNPMLPGTLTNVTGGLVEFERFVQIGASSIVMPNVTCKEGAVAGAFSLIQNDLEPWTINVGIPSKKIKDRSKNILKLKDSVSG